MKSWSVIYMKQEKNILNDSDLYEIFRLYEKYPIYTVKNWIKVA